MNYQEQFVVFCLNTELYGIPINEVKEIVKNQPAARLPDMPSYMEGIINLRGQVTTIINLKRKFGLSGNDNVPESKIVILGNQNMGFVVDEVKEIINVDEKDVEWANNLNIDLEQSSIFQIVKRKETVIVTLDVKKLIENESMLKQ